VIGQSKVLHILCQYTQQIHRGITTFISKHNVLCAKLLCILC